MKPVESVWFWRDTTILQREDGGFITYEDGVTTPLVELGNEIVSEILGDALRRISELERSLEVNREMHDLLGRVKP